MAGRLLNALPDQLGMQDRDARACTVAGECFACCYAVDLACAVPFMQNVETGENRYNLAFFPFYELCWPCLWSARACGLIDNPGIRALVRRPNLFHVIDEAAPAQ